MAPARSKPLALPVVIAATTVSVPCVMSVFIVMESWSCRVSVFSAYCTDDCCSFLCVCLFTTYLWSTHNVPGVSSKCVLVRVTYFQRGSICWSLPQSARRASSLRSSLQSSLGTWKWARAGLSLWGHLSSRWPVQKLFSRVPCSWCWAQFVTVEVNHVKLRQPWLERGMFGLASWGLPVSMFTFYSCWLFTNDPVILASYWISIFPQIWELRLRQLEQLPEPWAEFGTLIYRVQFSAPWKSGRSGLDRAVGPHCHCSQIGGAGGDSAPYQRRPTKGR